MPVWDRRVRAARHASYHQPPPEFPWLRKPDLEQLRGVTATREFAQILDIALRFAAQGREGKPIGTIFVLGELGQVSPFLRQLILNPFEGHSPESRNIHNPDFLETLREFAAMDGAFVVNHKGNVEFGGTYIDAPATEAKLREGLGRGTPPPPQSPPPRQRSRSSYPSLRGT